MAIVLVFIQVLLLGNIHILGVASPLLYIYFVVQTPRNTPRWLILVSCFIQGLLIDIFFSTPGMAAASMTLVGFVQPRIFIMPMIKTIVLAFKLWVQRDLRHMCCS